jgi:hypothetical protein
MRASARHDHRVSISLERNEEFKHQDRDGKPFYVRTIHYAGDGTAMVNGNMIKVNGERGLNDRYGRLRAESLPKPIFDALVAALKADVCTHTLDPLLNPEVNNG